MPKQISIDWYYDDRVARLGSEYAIILMAVVPPGVSREKVKELSARLAFLAKERLSIDVEPSDPIRCRMCGVETGPKDRVRVAVCISCAFHGREPGSDG
jgi:hypothetical protein